MSKKPGNQLGKEFKAAAVGRWRWGHGSDFLSDFCQTNPSHFLHYAPHLETLKKFFRFSKGGKRTQIEPKCDPTMQALRRIEAAVPAWTQRSQKGGRGASLGRGSFSSCIFCRMTFNGGMSIWIFAILLMAAVSLAGWRQGAIRAAFAFVGILFAALLAVPIGHLFQPLLPHLGAGPIAAWALAPVAGFILVRIPFGVASHYVHQRVEHFYKYAAGDLRLALWARLNARLGICIGLMNGAAYFVLISFFIFNMAYWTTQAAADSSAQPVSVRLVNSLGEGLQSSGFSQTASAVGTLSPTYYKLADFSGLVLQNPQLGPRLVAYPGLISLWHRDEMQPLVTDPNLTNELAAGTSLSEIAKEPTVVALLANKDLSKLVMGVVLSNLDDLTVYANTGQSAKYAGEQILGNWTFNASVTLAWLRQEQPKMNQNEMAALRALWPQAYGQTTFLLTADNQIFVKGWPKFVTPQPNQPPFQPQDGKGDWSRDGSNYTLHANLNGDDKYLSATCDGLRLRVKDGRNLLIFDHAN